MVKHHDYYYYYYYYYYWRLEERAAKASSAENHPYVEYGVGAAVVAGGVMDEYGVDLGCVL